MRFRLPAALAALLLMLPHSPAQSQIRRLGAPPVCPAGQRLCAGPYGAECYMPASGASCSAGLVCGAGQRACAGPYGAGCYAPTAGQQCQAGLVCGPGQQVCAVDGYARCFSPASGDHC
jgi:hypothetical protein